MTVVCPVPLEGSAEILMSHGGGGRMTQKLLEQVFYPAFANPTLDQRGDAAVIPIGGERLAFTTDSFVVKPLFFPGGDIGSLSVFGSVNDLAMMGAKPLALSAGFILEEGYPLSDLRRVVQSMARAAQTAQVSIVTGDTKVVDKGKGDGLFINTSGVGVVLANHPLGPAEVRPGDVILVSGDLGRHGMALLSVREGLSFSTELESDAAPLWPLVDLLLKEGVTVHALRDLTRGGLAAALNELAESARVTMEIEESAIPVSQEVEGACEILGLDPLYVANEGRLVAIIPYAEAERALSLLHTHPLGAGAVIAGRVSERGGTPVLVHTTLGSTRALDLFSGEQLPRIC